MRGLVLRNSLWEVSLRVDRSRVVSWRALYTDCMHEIIIRVLIVLIVRLSYTGKFVSAAPKDFLHLLVLGRVGPNTGGRGVRIRGLFRQVVNPRDILVIAALIAEIFDLPTRQVEKSSLIFKGNLLTRTHGSRTHGDHLLASDGSVGSL